MAELVTHSSQKWAVVRDLCYLSTDSETVYHFDSNRVWSMFVGDLRQAISVKVMAWRADNDIRDQP